MRDNGHTLFFGDIHNHNALGYGLGSLERSIEIARTHLDFFAFTGHSSWHDIPKMEAGREQFWLDGFDRLHRAWPEVQKLTADANQSGNFVSFLGFEWHSSQFGDQCIILPGDSHPLVTPQDIYGLRAYCRQHGGLMIPHHLAYATGHRGVNWEVFDPECSPVVEIISEHGCAETDVGPYPYFNHSMGGRVTANTAQAALDDGYVFGFVGSSDNHRGFPGAYGEGLLGVWCEELSRDSLLSAIRARRTIALTGDRIKLWFSVDGQPMGARIRGKETASVQFEVEGRGEIDTVDVIVNGQTVHRADGRRVAQRSMPGQVRFEWGWGPWADMTLDRICDWEFSIEVQDGKLLTYWPCLQSGPFDEHRRHRFERNDSSIKIQSYTGRRGSFRQNPNNSVVLELDGDQATQIVLKMSKPVELSRQFTIGALSESSAMIPTGPFPAESCLLHRVQFQSDTKLAGDVEVELQGKKSNYVYVRVHQTNGQMAWASPVFIERV